jgi:hypothetical protein
VAADPVKLLQAAARQVAGRFVPGAVPGAVEIKDAQGRVLFSVAVPAGSDGETQAEDAADPPTGWDVDERRALFEGKPVRVASSRLKLLRVLADARGPLTAEELTDLAFDSQTTLKNTRYHITLLKEELRKAFPSFEGELVEGGDDGYRLLLIR